MEPTTKNVTSVGLVKDIKKEKLMIVDINKQYRTQDGEKVRIYCIDGSGTYPVHGAIFDDEVEVWMVNSWTSKGMTREGHNDPYDLVEVKPRIQREYWMNLYNSGSGSVWKNRQNADEGAKGTKNNRIACVKIVIDCEEGEGL